MFYSKNIIQLLSYVYIVYIPHEVLKAINNLSEQVLWNYLLTQKVKAVYSFQKNDLCTFPKLPSLIMNTLWIFI